jgi:hypothetical protein
MTASPEALAAARATLRNHCVCIGEPLCDICEVIPVVALALDAFAQERALEQARRTGTMLAERLADEIEREKLEAVEAVLRALWNETLNDCDDPWPVAASALADALDRLAGRPVGTTLARVRADWCSVCGAPQMVMPDGEHRCG